MQATTDMAGGLKLIEAEMKALIAAKQKLRKLIAQVGRDITANAAPTDERPPLNFQIGMGSQQASTRHKCRLQTRSRKAG